jgi:hypothetical protein
MLLLKHQNFMKLFMPIFKAFALGLFIIVLSNTVICQTQPIPYNLSTGTFNFTSWDSLSPAGAYPPNMTFQYVPSNHSGPFYNDSSTDYSCPYNINKRPRFNGYMDKGISFITTSNSQYNDCSSGTASQRFVGSVLLSVNSALRSNIKVSWKSETLVPGDGNGTPATARIWNLRLQYRLGTSGNFTDVPGPVEFVAGTTTGDETSFGPTLLPAECNDKAVVQLRWIYFESSSGGAGTRPKLRLDDISVQSESNVGLDELFSSSLSLYPNPAHNEFIIRCPDFRSGAVKILNNIGKELRVLQYDGVNNHFDCTGLPAGIYLVQITDNDTQLSKVTKLVVK